MPTIIQEQNALPGLTNRILVHVVDKVALGYEAAMGGFRRRDKLVVTGNPIRPEIVAMSRREGAARLGLDPRRRLVLVTGASQGARSINRAVIEAFSQLRGLDAQILVAVGASGYEAFLAEISRHEPNGRPVLDGQGRRFGNVTVVPYLYDMPAALAAADLVVGRAGALSIAEFTARGLPVILIPYPHAAENHQEKNAKVLEEAGAARVIRDSELNGERVVSRRSRSSWAQVSCCKRCPTPAGDWGSPMRCGRLSRSSRGSSPPEKAAGRGNWNSGAFCHVELGFWVGNTYDGAGIAYYCPWSRGRHEGGEP